MNMKQKLKPRFVTIVHSPSPIAWFNHWIGESFRILDISKYNYAQIEYMDGWKGWVPLDCCDTHYFLPRPKAIETTEMLNEVAAV